MINEISNHFSLCFLYVLQKTSLWLKVYDKYIKIKKERENGKYFT